MNEQLVIDMKIPPLNEVKLDRDIIRLITKEDGEYCIAPEKLEKKALRRIGLDHEKKKKGLIPEEREQLEICRAEISQRCRGK